MPRSRSPQPDLFGASAGAPPGRAVRAARLEASVRELGTRLPGGIRLGTASWHFPGWVQLVYDHPADERVLARDGLTAYSSHPLLRCVSLDRTFYLPLGVAAYRHYAAQVPDDFRFMVKAPLACTAEVLRSRPGAAPAVNEHFLDPRFAVERFVMPCLEGLGEKVGPLVFQFPPLRRELTRKPEAFAMRLAQFLGALPHGPCYAVEVRDRGLVGSAYLDVLARAGVHHCLSLHPRMLVASEQARETALDRAGMLIARWNLHTGFSYEEAKGRYTPFNRLVDEDLPNRIALARLALAAAERGDQVYISVNNNAEGCAPLSVVKLAQQIVAHLGG